MADKFNEKDRVETTNLAGFDEGNEDNPILPIGSVATVLGSDDHGAWCLFDREDLMRRGPFLIGHGAGDEDDGYCPNFKLVEESAAD